MKKAVVLGAGMVGSVMAADLAADGAFAVTIVDRDERALAAARARSGGAIETVASDLSDAGAVARAVAGADVVLGALASRFGFATLRAVIEAGRPYVDISFMPEDALELDALARERGVTAVVDCGVAPGMSNMLAARGVADLDRADRVFICVGGLPVERRLPYQYKAGFAPSDVIEEYTRPARFVRNGRVVTGEALSAVEPIDFPGVGTLEAFLTDGLRSLVHTLDVPEMVEKTLRYPGHVDLMRAFRETGLFDETPVRVGDATVRPLDLTSALLFPKWTFEEGEEDLTVMRVEVSGEKDGAPAVRRWDLSDRYDRATRATSMARTTAFPATIVARLVAAGTIDAAGVLPPERLGGDAALLDRVLGALAERGVTYTTAHTGG